MVDGGVCGGERERDQPGGDGPTAHDWAGTAAVGRFLHFFSEVVTMARGSLSLSSQELFLFVGNSVTTLTMQDFITESKTLNYILFMVFLLMWQHIY